MLLIQITDPNGTRTVELPDQPFLVGSDPACDLVLDDPAITPEHLAIKPAGAGTWKFRVRKGRGVIHNGRPLREGVLVKGDRLKLGNVLMEISRAAHAKELVYRPPSRSRQRSRSAIPYRELAALAVLLVGSFVCWRIFRDNPALSNETVVQARHLMSQWRLRDAATKIKIIAARAGGNSDFAEVHKLLQEEMTRRSRALDEAQAFLEELWQRGRSLGHHKMAAAIRQRQAGAQKEGRSYLAQYLYSQLPGLPDEYHRRIGDGSGHRAREFAQGQKTRKIEVPEVMARVNRMVAENQVLAALQMLESARSEAGSPAAADDYKVRRGVILDRLRKGAAEVYERAIDLANSGRAGEALELLDMATGSLPVVAELRGTRKRIQDLVGDIRPLVPLTGGARPQPAPGASPKKPIDWGSITGERKAGKARARNRRAVSSVLREAEKSAREWRFTEAARLLGEVVAVYPEAAEMARWARLKAGFLRHLGEQVAARKERFKNIRLADGGRVDVVAADDKGFTVIDDGSGVAYGWAVMGLDGILVMGGRVPLANEAVLGLAAIALDAERHQEFDQILQRAIAADGSLARLAAPLLERRTGKEGPFSWHEGRWLPTREKEQLVRLAALAKDLDRVFQARRVEVRDQALAALVAKGDLERGAVAKGLEQRLFRDIEKLKANPFFRNYDRVAAVRKELDTRRQHALALIFDTVKYFYPYKPPECPPEKAKLYPAVQQEVLRRIAGVRKAWEKNVRARVTAPFKAQLDRIFWLHGHLQKLGAAGPDLADMMEVVLRLPRGAEEVTVRNFAWTAKEQRRLDYHRRIMRYNMVAEVEPTVEEMDQMQITNDYRLMFGHRPLAIHAKLLASARKHSQEMSDLGYFSHFSPVQEHRDPYQRMRLEGYTRGISENLASVPGAQGAHDRWLRSSGHHRNLLNPDHTEFATGNCGRLWTQNFGRGLSFEKDPLFERK